MSLTGIRLTVGGKPVVISVEDAVKLRDELITIFPLADGDFLKWLDADNLKLDIEVRQ